MPVAHNGIVARRRKTMPPMVLQKEIAEFRKQRKGILRIANATVFGMSIKYESNQSNQIAIAQFGGLV